jgi:hypothetical protein
MTEPERRWTRVLMIALEASVKMQSHYASLLNMHDGGARLLFPHATDWIARLSATRVIGSCEVHEIFEAMSKPPEEDRP